MALTRKEKKCVFRNGIPGKRGGRRRFAALLPEVCREKSVISPLSSPPQADPDLSSGRPLSSVVCQWPVV
jgi:hypothetical protein